MSEKKKILHLTLKKKWFDLIKSGQKKSEYREFKKYWMKRFGYPHIPKYPDYDEVHFRNGYSKNSAFMRVEYKGMIITGGTNVDYLEDNKLYYEIKLGKVLEVSE